MHSCIPGIKASPEHHVQQANRNVERTKLVRYAFIKGVPQKHQCELLQEQETTTGEDLSEKNTPQLMPENLFLKMLMSERSTKLSIQH